MKLRFLSLMAATALTTSVFADSATQNVTTAVSTNGPGGARMVNRVDPEHKTVEHSAFNADGTLHSRTVFERATGTRVTKATTYDAAGQVQRTEEYQYDGKGRLSETKRTEADGRILRRLQSRTGSTLEN